MLHRLLLALGLAKPDASADWVRSPDLQLEFDLANATLSGVGLGDSLQRLAFLGPCDKPSAGRGGEFRYHSLGVVVEAQLDKPGQPIRHFSVYHKCPWDPEFSAFPGVVLNKGEQIDLGSLTEEAFRQSFGEPDVREVDEEEILLTYHQAKRGWEVEFDLEGRFRMLLVAADRTE